MRFYPRNKAGGGSYYYVIKLPVDYKLANNQLNINSCSGSYHY